MIISVSRRTDIPAFFADWFGQRLARGWVEVHNPYRPSQARRVSLRRNDVDAFVFWTRQPLPLLPHLGKLDKRSFPYYFLITATGYPPFLEPQAPSPEQVKNCFARLHERIGRRRLIWRYDPIILCPQLDVPFHRQNFARLARELSPYCSRVIISWLDLYPKVVRRLARQGVTATPPGENQDQWQELFSHLGAVSGQFGLDIQSCAEATDWSRFSIGKGKCIDEQLLNQLFGLTLGYRKDPSQRPHCLCQQSVDIGQYSTCRLGCVYCYAR